MHFIPFVAIFFYGLCFFVLPIAATLLEGKPVTFRFQVPYITFFNLMINATVIAFAFRVCHRIYHEGWLTRLWQKLGYFKVPTNRQIWIWSFTSCCYCSFTKSSICCMVLLSFTSSPFESYMQRLSVDTSVFLVLQGF